jgi:hypothetical protein
MHTIPSVILLCAIASAQCTQLPPYNGPCGPYPTHSPCGTYLPAFPPWCPSAVGYWPPLITTSTALNNRQSGNLAFCTTGGNNPIFVFGSCGIGDSITFNIELNIRLLSALGLYPAAFNPSYGSSFVMVFIAPLGHPSLPTPYGSWSGYCPVAQYEVPIAFFGIAPPSYPCQGNLIAITQSVDAIGAFNPLRGNTWSIQVLFMIPDLTNSIYLTFLSFYQNVFIP